MNTKWDFVAIETLYQHIGYTCNIMDKEGDWWLLGWGDNNNRMMSRGAGLGAIG